MSEAKVGAVAPGPGEMMGNAGPGMLAGLRVIEIADERAEYTGLLLAGLGAEVIKIEPPEGNATRRIGPFLEDQPGLERSLFFWNYNRNKKSGRIGSADAGRARAPAAPAGAAPTSCSMRAAARSTKCWSSTTQRSTRASRNSSQRG